MAIRKAAEISLGIKSKFSVDWWKKFKAKRKIKNVKHLFEELDIQANAFNVANKEVSIDAVKSSMDRRIKIESEIEEGFASVEETAQIFEYEGIKSLLELHDSLNNYLNKSKGQIPLGSLKNFVEKFNGIISKITPRLEQQAQMLRRETIGRYMIRDATMFKAYLLKYWQMRRLIRNLRKDVVAIERDGKAIISDFNKLSKTDKSKKVISDLDKRVVRFDKSLESCITHTYSLTQMIVILRHQLLRYIDRVKTDIKSLESDGYPQEELKIMLNHISELETKFEKDIEKEYAKARALSHKAEGAKGGKAGNVKSFKKATDAMNKAA
jgi:hypothetical protein